MKQLNEWQVPMDMKGSRLDQVLAGLIPDTSRSTLQEMIKSGHVKVAGVAVKPGLKLKGGELVTLQWEEKTPTLLLKPTIMDFPILFEDQHLIVIDKPVGLTVHPGAGRETISVVSAILSHATLSPIGAPLRPGVVHRLDKATSGVMILAKTEKCHRKLAKLFSSRTMTKEYFALCQGTIKEDRGVIEVAIERDRVHRKKMKATRPERGRPSKSLFEVVERLSGATLVKVRIETGRTHQIRVHMAFIGHPLYGDVLYGGSRFFGELVHFLHSHRIAIDHPMTGKPIEWIAPLPPAFQDAVSKLRQGPKKK